MEGFIVDHRAHRTIVSVQAHRIGFDGDGFRGRADIELEIRFVENMPLNGRNFGGLIELTPGVVPVPTNFF